MRSGWFSDAAVWFLSGFGLSLWFLWGWCNIQFIDFWGATLAVSSSGWFVVITFHSIGVFVQVVVLDFGCCFRAWNVVLGVVLGVSLPDFGVGGFRV